MAENTKIEWADHTFNPWIGCQSASPEGCKNCYAEALVKRFGGDFSERRRTSEANWKLPLKWNRQAERAGRRFRVFCASLADVFDNQVPVQWRISLMRLIMETPNLDWLLLTKRIGNASAMLEQAMRGHTAQREGWRDNVPPNVWIGATVVNQVEADRDIPKLLAVPAARRFLSIEPMLGLIDFYKVSASIPNEGHPWSNGPILQGIDWVICGGESGHNARPMRAAWAQSLRDQCAAAGVPFLFKQWGEHLGEHQDGAHDHEPIELNATDDPVRVGKKAAGRLLDGVEHNGFPEGGAA